MEEQMSTNKIPQTDSIQELARFWDTHDLSDFENELEEVSDPVFERGTKVSIQLRQEHLEAIKQLAKARGLDYGELIRQWVLEQIRAA